MALIMAIKFDPEATRHQRSLTDALNLCGPLPAMLKSSRQRRLGREAHFVHMSVYKSRPTPEKVQGLVGNGGMLPKCGRQKSPRSR